jgi:two-component system, NtrC family, response regulator HydG
LPRILLVEDNLDVRLLLEHVLLDEGYEVDTTATVRGGKELLGCGSYDLILADGKLPDGHGAEIADAATEKGVKALIVTGYAFTLPVMARKCYEVILKPVRPAELVGAVQRVLGG